MSLLPWLLAAQPWTRYHTLLDLLDRPENDPEVQDARDAMLVHADTKSLVTRAFERELQPVKRHNDASHPLAALTVLADFGLREGDPGLQAVVEGVLEHVSDEGAFQSLVNVSPAFGGSGEDMWSWMGCDCPTLLYALLAFGMGSDERVLRAVDHLVSLARPDGWGCTSAPELGGFRGPGRKSDPCPIANLLALKALWQSHEAVESCAAASGVSVLLNLWDQRANRKPYLFGMGTDFAKLKYPMIWYDILHVVDVLSHYPCAREDPRFREMLGVVTALTDAEGRYTAGSMYRFWKGWCFAEKGKPSPWLTFLVLRICKRTGIEF